MFISIRSALQRLTPPPQSLPRSSATTANQLLCKDLRDRHDPIVTLSQQSSSILFMNHKCNLSTTPLQFRVFGPPDPDGPPPARKNFKESLLPPGWLKLVEKYPDFLPDPMQNNPLHVSLQVEEMLRRRCVVEIPEFYVGSILAVTCSDQYSETKRTRFVGICIQRTGQLLWSNFTLRNVIDGMGVEIRYDLYNPLIISIDVLRLEKRLDDDLIYLRDALPEYSTFPENMRPEVLEEGAEVPVNKLLVKMGPRPWSRRWERRLLRGIEKLEDVPQLWVERMKEIENCNVNNYDTIMEYRRHCTEEQLYTICRRLADHEKNVVEVRKEARTRRFLRVSKKAPLAQESASVEESIQQQEPQVQQGDDDSPTPPTDKSQPKDVKQ